MSDRMNNAVERMDEANEQGGGVGAESDKITE